MHFSGASASGNSLDIGSRVTSPSARPGAPQLVHGPGHPLLPDPVSALMPHVSGTRHRYYRAILFRGLALFAVASVAAGTSNPILEVAGMIGVLVLGSFLVPIVYVEYLDELDLFSGVRRWFLVEIGLLTAVVAIPLAVVLEGVSHAGAGALVPAMLTGLIEEAAKLLVVWWILRRMAYRFELDGVIIGAAAGMGFGAFETLAYGLKALAQGGTPDLVATLAARMVLSPFGHGTWTAAICAVIWRERFTGQGRLDWRVLAAYLVSSGLHAAWDLPPWPGFGGLVWFLAVGWVGVVVLGVRIHEALNQEEAADLQYAASAAHTGSERVPTAQSRPRLVSGVSLAVCVLTVLAVGLFLVDPFGVLVLIFIAVSFALSVRTRWVRRYWTNLTGPLLPFPATVKRAHKRRYMR